MGNLFSAAIGPLLALRVQGESRQPNYRKTIRIPRSTLTSLHQLRGQAPLNRVQRFTTQFHHMLRPSQES